MNDEFVRIIPTRVGTSLPKSIRRPLYQDHPHACGDKLSYPLPYRRMPGSSPRVWGQVHTKD